MKKLLSLLMVLVTVFTFCGCDVNENAAVEQNGNVSEKGNPEKILASEKDDEEPSSEEKENMTSQKEEEKTDEESEESTDGDMPDVAVIPVPIPENITVEKNEKESEEKVQEESSVAVVEETEEVASEETEPVETAVYRTKTGKKYHMEYCHHLKSKIETTVSEAKSMGLGPCSVCNPPQ